MQGLAARCPMAYKLSYGRSAVPTTTAEDSPTYRLRYSDYSTTAEGPPDPARWIGPPGPPGPPGPQGETGNNALVLSADAPPTGVADNTLWWDSANTGLYIWTYDGTSRQWVSAAIGAGIGTFLPLTGGTLTGPLLYTATGGSVARAAQDRWADVANVLDYGADPTRATDSTAAFQAAAAT